MAKTKNTLHVPLVVTGYILFGLLVVATLLSTTIPFGRILFDPRSLHLNVAVMMIALTVGAILPVLIGYLIGDHAVKGKSRLSHHFNGVLFGLLAYWLIMLSVFIPIPNELVRDFNTRTIVVNLVPSICIAIVTIVLAIAHVRSRQAKQDVLDYKPFSVLLIAAIGAIPLLSFINNIATNSVNIYTFVSPLAIIVLGVISYVTLLKARLSVYSRVVWAAVSLSVLFIAVYVSFQLVNSIATYLEPRPTMESQSLETWGAFILALVGWGIYWAKQVKVLR